MINSSRRRNPNPFFSLLLSRGAMYSQTPAVQASAPVATSPSASAGLVNDWLREQDTNFSSFELGGQFRMRYLDQTYFAVPGAGATAVDFRANTPVSGNDLLLLRTRVHLGWSPADWFTVYGAGQNSEDIGDARRPKPQADGPFDLHQGYVNVGGTEALPVSLKVGRQELSYGDERLIGAFDWDNIGRTFESAKLHYEQGQLWVDAFSGRVVIPKDGQFNQPNWNDWFSGVYSSSRAVVPKTELQLYFLADNASVNSPTAIGTGVKGNTPRDIYTVGMRFQTLPGKLNGWDFNGEFAGQFGNFEYAAKTPSAVNGQRLNHVAFATHIEGGYTFSKVDWKPRAALGFDYGSGDDNPSDTKHTTFVNLFATNHKFYGSMDFLSWQNTLDPYFKVTVAPVKGLTIAAIYNAFWMTTTGDFLYQANQAPRTTSGYGIRSQGGSFAGQELDLIATYSPTKFLQIQGGYGHFLTGGYINHTFQKLGGSHDADWVFLQAQITL
ncbi:MAG: hypothetical protein EXS36_05905 [Pedosphaera sp.]|nr:hypothetical protein [Pedosphaera sp.]